MKAAWLDKPADIRNRFFRKPQDHSSYEIIS